MTAIQVSSNATDMIINIPKSSISPEIVMQIINRFRMEELVQKADFEQDLDALGEDIKADWWERNKDKYLSKIQ